MISDGNCISRSVKPCLKKLKEFSQIYYIELLIFTFNLAQGLRVSASFPLFYNKVCLELFSNNSRICSQLQSNKDAENRLQSQTAKWLMFNKIITFVPNLLTAMFFGSFSDRYGRKIPTLISICSMVVHTFLYMIFIWSSLFPTYSLILEAGIVAFGGTKVVFFAAQFAEAAHQMKDKSKLTQRFSVMAGCVSCAIFVAGNVSVLLMHYFSLLWILTIAEMVMVFTFILAIIFHSPVVENLPIAKSGTTTWLKQHFTETYGKTVSPRKLYSVNFDDTISTKEQQSWIMQMINLYKIAWITLTKSRPNYGRLRLLIFCFVALMYSCADSGMDQVTTLYVFHSPLSWTPTIFSGWMGTMNIVQLFGGILGTYFLKRFNFSDYTVLLIGILSTTCKMICTSIATQTWVMYLSLCLGCVSNIGISGIRSLITHEGSPQETSQLISVLSIVIGWSQLLGSLMCNNIYTATVHILPGTVFIVVAILLTLCFIVIIAVWKFTNCDYE